MLRPAATLALGVVLAAGFFPPVAALRAQDEPHAGPEGEPLAVFPSPTERESEPEEPSIEEIEAALPPTHSTPEWRIRVGGGVSIPAAGSSVVAGRVTQEVEVQPKAGEFLLFGLGGAQSITSVGVLWQVGARIGGHATFCEDGLVRCQGAVAIQVGLSGGTRELHFDVAADADLRLLLANVLELHLRGGFFTIELASFVNLTGGLGIAF